MFKSKSRTFQYSSVTDEQMSFGKSSLDHTLEDFLDAEQDEKPCYINAATLSRAFIMLSTIGYFLFHLGLDMGPRSFYALPFFGGIFLVLASSCHFVGEKKPKKKNKTNVDVFDGQHYPYEPFRYEEFGKGFNQSIRHFNLGMITIKNKTSKEFDVFGSDESKSFTMGQTQYDDNLHNTGRGRTNTFQTDSTTYSWGYYQQKNSNQLYKSRNDKKLWGVCGGLAIFFCIGTIWVRTIFVVAFFMGWGSSLLIYIALGLILNKEPLDLDYPDKW